MNFTNRMLLMNAVDHVKDSATKIPKTEKHQIYSQLVETLSDVRKAKALIRTIQAWPFEDDEDDIIDVEESGLE